MISKWVLGSHVGGLIGLEQEMGQWSLIYAQDRHTDLGDFESEREREGEGETGRVLCTMKEASVTFCVL